MNDAFDFSGVAVVLVMAGALLLVGGLARALHQRLLQMGIDQATDTIERLLGLLADPAPHDLTLVDEGRHPPDARGFIDGVTSAARAAGFTLLGDLEDRTLGKAMPEARTAMRGLLGDDGAIVCVAWGRPGQGNVPPVHVIELGSELQDGRFVETIAAPEMPTFDVGPAILLERLPSSTTFAALLERHRARLLELGPTTTVSDVDGAIQGSHRRVALAAAHRRTIPALVTREELQRMAGAEPAIVDQVYAELLKRQGRRR